MSDTSHPWERQPDETTKAYGAFFTYLELGPSRSRDKAYRKATGKLDAQASGHWIKWQREQRWYERATAFDMHELEAKLETRELVRDLARQMILDKTAELVGQALELALKPGKVENGQVKMIADLLDRAGLAAPKETKVDIGSSGPTTITVQIGAER